MIGVVYFVYSFSLLYMPGLLRTLLLSVRQKAVPFLFPLGKYPKKDPKEYCPTCTALQVYSALSFSKVRHTAEYVTLRRVGDLFLRWRRRSVGRNSDLSWRTSSSKGSEEKERWEVKRMSKAVPAEQP